MRKTLPVWIAALGCVGCPIAHAAQVQNDASGPMIPLAKEGPMYSGAINKVVGQCGLFPLQQTPLPANNLEIRIWEGFGEGFLHGYVLRRTEGVWSAVVLLPKFANHKSQQYQRAPPAPKAGWPAFWSYSQALGLLTLPDSLPLANEQRVYDGTSYVVEIRDGSKYRTYHYSNPKYQAWPQAKQMVKIAEMLHRQFPAPL